MNKMNIKKGDTVYVLSGNDRKHTGRVLKVLPAKQAAIVEGIRMVTKATKPNAKNPQGGLVKTEAPIHISNLALIDPKTASPPVLPIARTKTANACVTLKNQERRLSNDNNTSERL